MKWLELVQDNLHMKFLALNVDFSSLKSRSPRFIKPGASGRQRWLPLLKSGYFTTILAKSGEVGAIVIETWNFVDFYASTNLVASGIMFLECLCVHAFV